MILKILVKFAKTPDATGLTCAICTSWNLLDKIVNIYIVLRSFWQRFYGHGESNIVILSPLCHNCLSVPNNDDLGNKISPNDYNHTCEIFSNK